MLVQNRVAIVNQSTAICLKLLLVCLFSDGPLPIFAQRNTHLSKRQVQLGPVKMVARLTGTPLPTDSVPSPNNTANDYDVGGTDLGIMWAMDSTQVGVFFGDTNGKTFVPSAKGGGNGNNWRSNVVAFSADTNLVDGLTFSHMLLDSVAQAGEVCAGAKANPRVYQTSIPTSAIRAAGVDYVHYMNIYEWAGKNGRWLTNFSSLYASYDGGVSWSRKHEVTFKPDSKFSQVAYAKQGGFVYMVGTLAGRGSAAYLARVSEPQLLNLPAYEYWNGASKKWVRGLEDAATPIINGPVGEASLLYVEAFKKWIIAYSYDAAYEAVNPRKMHAIVYRDADALNGKWSDLKILATDKEYPGLYSPYFYPLKTKGSTIYFAMSLWNPYNVFLMSTDLKSF